MKNGKVLFIPFIISVIIISGCTSQDQQLSANTQEAKCGKIVFGILSENSECFVSDLQSCSKSKLNIKMSDTEDVYSLEVLGQDSEGCKVKFTIEDGKTEDISKLKGKSVTCLQNNDELNGMLADLKTDKLTGLDAQRYVELMFTGVWMHLDGGSNLCKGELMDLVSE